MLKLGCCFPQPW